MYAKTKKETEALQDFDRVIARWPKEESAAAAWQRAAQIYAGRQDLANMAEVLRRADQEFPEDLSRRPGGSPFPAGPCGV